MLLRPTLTRQWRARASLCRPEGTAGLQSGSSSTKITAQSAPSIRTQQKEKKNRLKRSIYQSGATIPERINPIIIRKNRLQRTQLNEAVRRTRNDLKLQQEKQTLPFFTEALFMQDVGPERSGEKRNLTRFWSELMMIFLQLLHPFFKMFTGAFSNYSNINLLSGWSHFCCAFLCATDKRKSGAQWRRRSET